MTSSLAPDVDVDVRFTSAICTPDQVATLSEMSTSTVYSWVAHKPQRGPLVHRISPERRGWPSVPLIGVAEAYTLRALRQAGVPLRKLVAAAEYLREKHNDPYAMASTSIVTDGIDLYVEELGELFRLEDRQMPIRSIVEDYLQRVVRAPDGYAEAITINLQGGAELIIDPRFNSGRPSFERNRVPAFAILGALDAGERIEMIAEDFDLARGEVAAIDNSRGMLERLA